ncbi:MAG: MFS transporter [Armatimonadetes bacterium]|nr:MFS transporter [Armatimonadota bacterium]
MRASIRNRLRRADPQLRLFLAAVFTLGIASGIFHTTFNNYLNDTFHIDAAVRGWLEFPRELPGFLVALLAGALYFLAETRVAAVAAAILGAGLLGLGLLGSHWATMLVFTIAWSIGGHIEMPMRSAIAMSLGTRNQHGRRLGQAAAARVGASVVSGLFVWIIMDNIGHNYSVTFITGAGLAMIAALVYASMRVPTQVKRREKLVIKGRYWLYYVLCTLFGARKQVFLTFAPWVLVKVFGQPATTFAKLWMVSAVIGMFFQQALGDLIDRWGERRVLMADGVALVIICLLYGFADKLGLGAWTIWVLYACYITDQLLFGVENARSAYLAKIADKPEDVSASLSMGISINHAVSMLVPWAGGKYLWERYGYRWVFVAAAGVATLTIFAASLVKTKPGREAPADERCPGD